MKKALILVLAMDAVAILFPLAIQAQNFTVDIPEKNTIALRGTPSVDSKVSNGNVVRGDQVRVIKLERNGWCLVEFKAPDKEPVEGYVLMKRLEPVAGDEEAIALKASAGTYVGFEGKVITWGIIILAIGLLFSFFKFLGHVRTAILFIAIMALSSMEMYFFLTNGSFSFYLPSVVGWKSAVMWFGLFLVFLFAQILLFMRTGDSIHPKLGGLFLASNGLLAVMVPVLTFLLGLLLYWVFFVFGKGIAWITGTVNWAPSVFLLKLAEGIKWIGVWVINHFTLSLLIILALSVIFLIRTAIVDKKIPVMKTLLLFLPLYIVGFTAICFMFRDVLWVIFCVAGGLFFGMKMLGAAGSGVGWSQVTLGRFNFAKFGRWK